MPTQSPPSVIGQVRDVFPKLGEITDKVLFGDVWERKGLSKRDRSLITVAADIPHCHAVVLRRGMQFLYQLLQALLGERWNRQPDDF